MKKLMIAGHDAGPAYTLPATELLAADDGWASLQRGIGASLEALHRATGRDGIAWVALLDGLDRLNRPAELISVIFTLDLTELPEWDPAVVDEPLRQVSPGLTIEGVHPVPAEGAFATLAMVDGVLHEVWQEEEGAPPVVLWLALDEDDGSVAVWGTEHGDPREGGFASAPGVIFVVPDAPNIDDPEIERLVVVLLTDAALRIYYTSSQGEQVGRALADQLGPRLLASDLVGENGGLDHEAIGRELRDAVHRVADALDTEQKGQAFRTLYAIAAAGGIGPAEATILAQVAEILGYEP